MVNVFDFRQSLNRQTTLKVCNHGAFILNFFVQTQSAELWHKVKCTVAVEYSEWYWGYTPESDVIKGNIKNTDRVVSKNMDKIW